MIHVGQMLKLKPGCYDEYKRRHDELWPELAQAMGAYGIDMIIYRYENLVFVHGAAPSDEAWEKLASKPVTVRWDRYMADVLEADEHGELFCQALPPAFAFGAYQS